MLKNLIFNLFPISKIFFRRPTTLFEGLKLLFDVLLSTWIYLFIYFYVLTPMLYEYKIQKAQVHIYTNQKNYLEYKPILQTIENSIKSNTLYDESVKINIQYLDNGVLYKILNPSYLFVAPSYASTFRKNIIFHETDLEKKEIFRYPNDSKKESLEGILLHESIHVLQYHRYGIMKMRFNIPQWVTEGYAEYCAQNFMKRSTDTNFLSIIKKPKEKINMGEKYVIWGFIVKYAIEKMHKSVDDLHQGKADYDEVLDSLLAEYNITDNF